MKSKQSKTLRNPEPLAMTDRDPIPELAWISGTGRTAASLPTRPEPSRSEPARRRKEQEVPLTPVEEVRSMIRRIEQQGLPVKVELGCGPRKSSGFLGIDRFPFPGVDIIADLDQRLPLDDNSIDLLLAIHSLEHVSDLMATMTEVDRICKHGTQICILVPYYSTDLNLANPFHKQSWNEHTPRFLTAAKKTPIPPEEFAFPHRPVGDWGLGESGCSHIQMDLRCVRMEFFYFPEYLDLPVEQQRQIRKSRPNVCDQIMYHLIAIKEPCTDEEFDRLIEGFQPFIPPPVVHRRWDESMARLRDLLEKKESRCDELQTTVNQLKQDRDNLTKAREADQNRMQALRVEVEALKKDQQRLEKLVEEKRNRCNELQNTVNQLNDDRNRLSQALDTTKAGLNQLASALKSEQDRLNGIINAKERRCVELQEVVNRLKQDRESLTEARNADQGRIQAAQESLQSQRAELKTLKEVREQLKSQIDKKESRCVELQKTVNQLKEDRVKLTEDSAAHQARNKQLTGELGRQKIDGDRLIQLHQESEQRCRALEERIQALKLDNAKLVKQCHENQEDLERSRATNEKLGQQLAAAKANDLELNNTIQSLKKQYQDNLDHQAQAQQEEQPISELRSQIQSLETAEADRKRLQQSIETLQSQINRLEQDLLRQKQRRMLLEGQLEHYRHHRQSKWVRLLDSKIDLSAEVPPTLSALFKGSAQVYPDLEGYVLQLSDDLRSVDFRSYQVHCDQANWSGVSLAFFADQLEAEGDIGIEIVSEANEILRSQVLPVSNVKDDQPVSFKFDPIAESAGARFGLRCFARRNCTTGIRVYEWQLARPQILGRQAGRMFCALQFG